MPNPPHQDKPGRLPARVAIFLSAFVCPGLGQLAQRRWVAGACYMGAFLACFVIFVIAFGRIIIAYYSLAFGDSTTESPSLWPGLLAFTAALVVYIAGLFDTFRGNIRAARATRAPPGFAGPPVAGGAP